MYPKELFYTDGDAIPAAIVKDAEEEIAQRIGWGQTPPVIELPDEKTKEQLQAECDTLDIEYDKRWGVEKLRQAIEAVK
jgi:hypothetical protein